jgi:beta-glucosidase/6-phospho-beta-glucosidase/beta-galactosidase
MGRGAPAKGSDWYAWVHNKDNIAAGRVSGDTPLDGPGSWELYPEDFRIAREELGNNGIRLSLDWSRLFPRSTEAVEVEVERDERRERYLLDHLEQIHAVIERGVPVKGYFHWSLIDNFEWADGFKIPFGLYRVNGETKERIPTKAVRLYKKIAEGNELP